MNEAQSFGRYIRNQEAFADRLLWKLLTTAFRTFLATHAHQLIVLCKCLFKFLILSVVIIKKRLYEWQHHFSELCDRETNDTIVSIYCKLEIYIIRFCLIIQLARWTCGECDKTCIDLLTVERAIKLTEYFKESALNVQNVLNENTLNSQQQTIVNLLPPSFTTAQAIQIAEQNGMKERTFQRFLNDNIGTLFRKEKHGEYSKINP